MCVFFTAFLSYNVRCLSWFVKWDYFSRSLIWTSKQQRAWDGEVLGPAFWWVRTSPFPKRLRCGHQRPESHYILCCTMIVTSSSWITFTLLKTSSSLVTLLNQGLETLFLIESVNIFSFKGLGFVPTIYFLWGSVEAVLLTNSYGCLLIKQFTKSKGWWAVHFWVSL